jgi:UDP-glucuronate 4-epimerase
VAHYLVTGVAGFIGSRVSEMLLAEGHTVYGVDNLNNTYDIRMKEYRLRRLSTSTGFTFERIDIASREAVGAIKSNIGHPDAIINLAARAGVRSSVEDPWAYLDTNTTGTLNLLELCRCWKIPKFVLASTSSLYGVQNSIPYSEDANTDFPIQPYAASKKGAEAMCYAYHYLHGIDTTVLRYFTVYGPAGRPDMVMFRFAQWISEGRIVHVNGDGNQSRGFSYIDDIARGTLLGLKPLGYEVINLRGQEMITLNQLISVFEDVFGKKAQVEYDSIHSADAMESIARIDKARALLGWSPEVCLQDGITYLKDWYFNEREWASKINTN